MNLKEAVGFVYDRLKKSPAEQFEVFASEGHELALEIFKGQIKTTEMSSSSGLGIRLFYKKRPGYAYSEKFTKEALENIVEASLQNSQYLDELPLDLPEAQDPPKIDLKLYHHDIESIGVEKMKEFGLKLEDLAYSLDSRIVNVPYLVVQKNMSQSIFYNSKGLFYETNKASFGVALGVLATEGGSTKMGFSSKGGRSFHFQEKEIASEAVNRATSLLHAQKIPKGKYPVLLRNFVASQIFSLYVPIFFAEMAQKGKSRLVNKKGEKIASDRFSLYSDPLLPEEPGSYYFDGEGVKARKITLIEDGVFLNFLHNLETAHRAGEEPTGHAFRSYTGKVSTQFANLVVPKGNYTLEELQKLFPEILQIEKLEGSASCSFVSGELSIGAQGFLLKNGEISQKVDQITLNGNFFELINSIPALSREYSDNFSPVKVPDLITLALYIAG